VLDERVESAVGHINVGTMHLAKGVEFRAGRVFAFALHFFVKDATNGSRQKSMAFADNARRA
jgi:hypothetical protein